MELSFEALLDSGIDYRKKKVGCFMSGVSKFEVAVSVYLDQYISENDLELRVPWILTVVLPPYPVPCATEYPTCWTLRARQYSLTRHAVPLLPEFISQSWQ
jgi:hypothetical protein